VVIPLTNPSKKRQTVTFKANVTTVSPGTGTPTGTVYFWPIGGSEIGSATLSSGIATVQTSFPSSGQSINAEYSGSVSELLDSMQATVTL